MPSDREAVADLLAERPDLEPALRDIYRQDIDGDWALDDLYVASGAFGEIVSRDIVESVGHDTYRLGDRAAVAAALNEAHVDATKPTEAGGDRFQCLQPYLTPHNVVLCSAFLLLIGVRVIPAFEAVFRVEFVVLSGIDSYV